MSRLRRLGSGVGLPAAVVASLIPVRAAAQPGSAVSQQAASEVDEVKA
jgi:hypothetical protein